MKERYKTMVNTLFNVNPNKFKEVAKNRTYEEFVSYLSSQPNFQVMSYLTEGDKRKLYKLSKGEIN